MFLTVFTKARNLHLSWKTQIQISAFKSAPQGFKTIFLLEVFSPKFCTLGGLSARLPARSHYVFGTCCDRPFQHGFSLVFSVLRQSPKGLQSSMSLLHSTLQPSGFKFVKMKAFTVKTTKFCISILISKSKFWVSYFKPLLLWIIMFIMS